MAEEETEPGTGTEREEKSEETPAAEERTADDYRKQLREYERNAKRASAKKDRELEELRAKLTEKETADLSEQEKAIAKAREDAKTEILTEVEKERRHDRLELSVTKAAAKTFADPDDALIQIERALSRGDLDPDDIFDTDGKVQTTALQSALDDLLERKPHLAAKAPGPGDSDAGKGSGRGKDLEAMSVEDHLASIRRTK